jgi:hypothetical protein
MTVRLSPAASVRSEALNPSPYCTCVSAVSGPSSSMPRKSAAAGMNASHKATTDAPSNEN